MSELFSLAGRVALVTGGSRGIGRMIAAAFLEHGSKVYLTARKAMACEETARELSTLGPCIAIQADISTADGVRVLAEQFRLHEDKLDILVNNAGAAWGEDFDTYPESGWDKTVDLNMKTPFFLTQALIPELRRAAQSRTAKVINIASIDGISCNPMETYAYHASKAGLIHLTKRMALRLIRENVAVSAIAPGAFATNMNRAARDNPQLVAAHVPAGRIGTDDDIAGAAVYLASRAGDYVIGATLVVDGGVTIARG